MLLVCGVDGRDSWFVVRDLGCDVRHSRCALWREGFGVY